MYQESFGRTEGGARRGKGVGPEAQAMFDALYRTLPVEWHGKDIVVSSSVIVGAPYGPDDCRLANRSGNAQALARVKKVVREIDSSLRSKVKLANHPSIG